MIKLAANFKFYRSILNVLLIALSLAFAGQWISLPLLDKLEHIAYDSRLKASMPNTIDPRVVIIDIDEQSLEKEGRWPWDRRKMANLTNRLFNDYHIKLLAFDVVFPEPDHSSGITWFNRLAENELSQDQAFLQAFNSIRPQLNFDDIFADSLKNRPVVLSFFSQTRSDHINPDNQLPPPVSPAPPFSVMFPLAQSFGANLKTLQNAAGAGGFFNNPMVDQDGKYRRLPLLIEYRASLYEALSLAIYRRYLAADSIGFITDEQENPDSPSLEGIQVKDYTIPTDEHSAILIPYRGKQGSFKYYSATDILNSKIDPAELTGKIAILGTTAAGLMDLRSTPVQNVYPGVEIHANIISALLDHNIKSKPRFMLGFEMLEILLLGVIACLAWDRVSLKYAVLIFTFLTMALITVNLRLWDKYNIDSILFSPLLLLTSLFLNHFSFAYFLETRKKFKLRKYFSQYIPPELVEQMAKSDEDFNLKAENREMSVFFTDVRGFTSISEQLEPHQLSELMNRILTPITLTIHKHKGTIDKYMGDAVMAFWGSPQLNPNHAAHAIAAAMDTLMALAEVNRDFSTKGWPEINLGIGINTGRMSVGNMGSTFRMAYTVLGDAVNLGSRLEGLTKQYGVCIIVSDATRKHAPGFLYRELDCVRVKGKQEPIGIYEPVCLLESANFAQIQELEKLQEALRQYRNRQWNSALGLFLELTDQNPEVRLYTIYRDRINYFLTNPPPADWDGVFNHDSK